MPKPTFLIIGAAKAGTSTLRHQLGQHPEIFMSSKKELHFFSFDPTYARGIDWYESWFENAGGYRQAGEASTSYSIRKVFPNAAERIATYEPGMRLIYIVRHPIERMESVWLQLRRLGSSPFGNVGMVGVPAELRVDLSFNKAVRRQAAAIVESTNYWKEINVYRQLFPDSQILVLLLEELNRDQGAVLRRCFEFLGVDPSVELADARAHLNSMQRYRVVRSLPWWFWASPARSNLYSRAANLLPGSVRARLSRSLLRTPVRARPRWEPDTRAWAWDQLREDIARFLEFYGYPPHVWRPPS